MSEDEIDRLVDEDPLELAHRLRATEAQLVLARRLVAQHEETLRWVKVIWAGKDHPSFIPGYLEGRLEEIR